MQISQNENKTKGNLEYYCTFLGSCQSLLSAVAFLHPGWWLLGSGTYISGEVDAQESAQKDWTSKILMQCLNQPLQATPGTCDGTS